MQMIFQFENICNRTQSLDLDDCSKRLVFFIFNKTDFEFVFSRHFQWKKFHCLVFRYYIYSWASQDKKVPTCVSNTSVLWKFQWKLSSFFAQTFSSNFIDLQRKILSCKWSCIVCALTSYRHYMSCNAFHYLFIDVMKQ